MATKADMTFDVKTYPYLDCREQHIWGHYDGSIDNKTKVAYRIQKCANCDMKRVQVLSMRVTDYGKVIKRNYQAPEGYYVPGGLDWRDLGQIRMHNFLAEIQKQKKK